MRRNSFKQSIEQIDERKVSILSNRMDLSIIL